MKRYLKAFKDHLKTRDIGISPLTISTYLHSIEKFIEWHELDSGETFNIDNITSSEIKGYKRYMQKMAGGNGSGYKPATINKNLAALRTFFNWQITDGLLQNKQNPVIVKNISVPLLAPRWLDINNEWRPLKRAVETNGSKRDIAIILLIRYTGIRARDLLALELHDINLSSATGKIIVHYGKGGKYRELELNKPARNALNDYLKERPETSETQVFLGKRGPLTYQGLRYIIEKYSKLAGLEHVTLRSLQRTFGKSLSYQDEANEEFYRTVAEMAYDGIAIVDKGLFIYTNPSLARILGRDIDSLIGAPFVQFLSKESAEEIGELYVRAMDGEQIPPQMEGAVIRSDGTVLEVEFSMSALDYPPDPRILVMTRDNSKQKDLERQLREMATIDPLTEVSNRRRLFDLGEIEINKSSRLGQALSLILIDLNKFKEVNDNYGHLVGDKVLKVVAQELKINLREIDVLARYGGDEFVILMPQTSIKEANITAQRLLKNIREKTISIGNKSINITISLGVATFEGQEPQRLDVLIDQADKALYQAKRLSTSEKN